MTNEPEQPDLFNWKPEEKKFAWLWKLVKSKVFLVILGSIIILLVVWFKLDTIKNFFTSDFYSKNSLLILGTLSLILTFLIIWLTPKWQVKPLNTKKGNPNQSEFDLEKERIKLRDDTRKTMAQIIGGVFFVAGLFITFNTYELNKESQVTDRFSKAVTLLKEDDVSVRIGGLFALERIAKDSPKDHSTIMEILAAFIREKSKEQWEKIRKEFEERGIKEVLGDGDPPTDVKAAIAIINRRVVENDQKDFFFDLSEANFFRLKIENAKFKSAKFESAKLNLIDLSSSDLSYSDFDRAALVGANLSNTNLTYAQMRWVSFLRANLVNSDLSYTDLRNTDFRDARLNKAKFINTNLFYADFSTTNPIEVDFTNAYLDRADFSFANLTTCRGLQFDNLSKAIIDENTKLPKYLENKRNELLQISEANSIRKKNNPHEIQTEFQ